MNSVSNHDNQLSVRVNYYHGNSGMYNLYYIPLLSLGIWRHAAPHSEHIDCKCGLVIKHIVITHRSKKEITYKYNYFVTKVTSLYYHIVMKYNHYYLYTAVFCPHW